MIKNSLDDNVEKERKIKTTPFERERERKIKTTPRERERERQQSKERETDDLLKKDQDI